MSSWSPFVSCFSKCKQGLVMNILPGTHLLLTPGGVNRGPVINTYPGAHLSPASGLLDNSLGPQL